MQGITFEIALQKMRDYCAKSERSHQDVLKKVRPLLLHGNKSEEIVAQLISEGFLNEERYTSAFIHDKVLMNKWGRKKLEFELKKKNISDYSIQIGMQEIDEKIYTNNLRELARKYWESKIREHPTTRKRKLWTYLMNKGYLYDEIKEINLSFF